MSPVTPLTHGPILVVDDNEAKRYTAVTVLRNAGFEVHEAATGKDGLWLAASLDPSLIVLDVNLPDISGFEVVKRLKTRSLTASIPVLHLSATRMRAEDRAEGLESGADAYLTGAVEPNEFIATVNALLRARRSEEIAKRLASQWQATFDAIYEGVCILDSQGQITQCNRQLASLLGVDVDDLIDRSYSAELQARLGLDDESLHVGSSQVSHRSAEVFGQNRWFQCTSDPIMDEHRARIGWVQTIREITGRKLQEVEISEARRLAEAANRAKSLFLANMSHEIRTPLGAILGFTELLHDDELPLEERRQFLASIRRNGHELALLIDDILDLSKVEAGQLRLEKIETPLASLVKDVTTSLSVKAREKAITLVVSAPSGLPKLVVTDPTRLRQILLNVVGNAIKFTESGGVTVTVGMEPAETSRGHRLTFHVADTGVGIAPEARTRLFQAFSQADATTTRRFGGTGLGLALSRRLAVALGGDLSLVRSAPGEGSEFLVAIDAGPVDLMLAVSPLQLTETEDACENPEAVLEGRRVLVAEDAPDNQFLIRRFLTAGGVLVDLVGNGAEAVEKARSFAYDAILMDIQMPVLDGYSATRELRRAGYTGPIIALTAHAMVEERQRCLEAGCNDHLTKPITSKRLAAMLRRHLVRSATA